MDIGAVEEDQERFRKNMPNKDSFLHSLNTQRQTETRNSQQWRGEESSANDQADLSDNGPGRDEKDERAELRKKQDRTRFPKYFSQEPEWAEESLKVVRETENEHTLVHNDDIRLELLDQFQNVEVPEQL